MLFSSLNFLYFYLPVVLAVYFLLPFRFKNLWLLLASLFFYAWGEPRYLFLMVFTIMLNFYGGILIDKAKKDKKKAKLLLVINTTLNLLLLVFFKYTDLLIGTVNRAVNSQIPLLGLALPIGISFYTFQSMTYPVDVYRGEVPVQKDPVKFGTFVALFPQLIAGPIVRYKDIADRLENREHSPERFSAGVERFMLGLCKKVLLANGIGSLWDAYHLSPPLTFAGAWMAAIAFSLQIYFDFSGYSDMAIGLGKMFGFDFLENFRYPYLASSVTDFWRRWHISLGSWFRDYVYIPLGGNRKGLARQILNLLIVWGLTGLWHGADWTFLLWGLYYALFLIAEKLFLLDQLKKAPLLGHIYAVLAAVFGWVLFETDTLSEAGVFYKAMLHLGDTETALPVDGYYFRSYAFTLLVCLLASTPLLKSLYLRLPARLRTVLEPLLIVSGLLLCTVVLTNESYNPFLYFRF